LKFYSFLGISLEAVMIDTFDKHIDFCCFYQYKTVIRIFRITENRLFENDFDRFPELENLVGKK